MKTKPFLRTTEFLWQEGHTAHATREEAEVETRAASDMYRTLAEDFLAIPVVQGKKSLAETFAGAEYTVSIEALAKDGKAIQAGTSHMLGQGFAKAFNIKYQDDNGSEQYVWQTSWGVSTRMVGVIIVVHGDDDGLVLPPNLAPFQTVIVPVYRTEDDKKQVMKEVEHMVKDFKTAGIRYKIDDRETVSIGYKINEWELKGVPVRIEIGPRDLANKTVVMARRDTKEKESVKLDNVLSHLQKLFPEMQKFIYDAAAKRIEEQTFVTDSYEEFKTMLEEKRGFYRIHWCGDAACETKIKEETAATSRVTSFDEAPEEGTCIICGKPSHMRTYFAKAY
jgi:prolyl-tRNA synthetase